MGGGRYNKVTYMVSVYAKCAHIRTGALLANLRSNNKYNVNLRSKILACHNRIMFYLYSL